MKSRRSKKFGDEPNQRPMRCDMIYAAFSPDTGYVMAPTMSCALDLTQKERDQFFRGCPIYKCFLQPIESVEVL